MFVCALAHVCIFVQTYACVLIFVQLIHLTRTEKGKAGHTKLFFLAGARALQALSSALDIQRKLTSTLTTTPDQHVTAAAKLQMDVVSGDVMM